jgi:hypothetical protein
LSHTAALRRTSLRRTLVLFFIIGQSLSQSAVLLASDK